MSDLSAIDEASLESFPASDPPSFTPLHAGDPARAPIVPASGALTKEEQRFRLGEQTITLAQGAFYVATGLWPIASMKTFQLVTGPKLDGWIVRTMGALIAAVGAGLVVAGREPRDGRVARSARVTGVLAACALGVSDVYYVARGRIARVYLLDAIAQAVIVAGHLLSARTLAVKRPPADV